MKTFEGEYQYRDVATAALAQQEQSKIQMLEGKMDYGNPKLVYSLYCKLLDKSVFKTYEGYAYLNHIHDFLTDHAVALTGLVPEINEQAYIMPVLVSELEAEAAAKAEELAAHEAAAKAEQLAAKEAEVTYESVAESIADAGKEESAEPAFAIENKVETQPEIVLVSSDTEQASGETEAESDNDDDSSEESEEDELSADIQRIKQRNLEDLMKKYKRTVGKNTKLRELLMFQRIAILLLIIIVIVMLTIAKKSDSPTILNYREKIQNEYASWEQQLKEKEQELREREKKLSENN
ncbi:MAG: hypothetical protein K6G87_01355 [Butyrivibrio sp.]|uniref:hypothetical protein n=1 Tax=Butyrivibrio sp. TaxID=28121 RepID=UPI0025E67F38|nr:hypothetical protein [Butyrivibrio sp.]MCR5769860.1 hypothetical protein [Butyrivibrio sp.]